MPSTQTRTASTQLRAPAVRPAEQSMPPTCPASQTVDGQTRRASSTAPKSQGASRNKKRSTQGTQLPAQSTDYFSLAPNPKSKVKSPPSPASQIGDGSTIKSPSKPTISKDGATQSQGGHQHRTNATQKKEALVRPSISPVQTSASMKQSRKKQEIQDDGRTNERSIHTKSDVRSVSYESSAPLKTRKAVSFVNYIEVVAFDKAVASSAVHKGQAKIYKTKGRKPVQAVKEDVV